MDQPFTAPSHHDVLLLLVQLAVLLFTARVLGAIAQRFGQPTVIGEISAGILLGPSLLSGFFPFIGEIVIPQTPVQGYILETISLLGVMLLLLVTGLETDLGLMRQQAKKAVGVSLGGLTVTLLTGFVLGMLVPDNLLVNPEQRIFFALFIATALAISAIPVLAKVLIDLNLTRRDIGQTILAAAMIDDTVGWILLSIVVGLIGGASLSVLGIVQSVGQVLAFIIISLTLGVWLMRRVIVFVQDNIHTPYKMLGLVFLMMFVWGALASALGLEPLLGAFIVGVIFSQMPSLNTDTIHTIESITLGVFSPIFFAVAGLKVNVLGLFTPELLLMTVIVIVVATVCKLLGVYLGARFLGGSDHWTAFFFGSALNARGSMGIIIATIGLTLNVLTQEMFSIIVVMAVFTSIIAPFGMRYALQNIKADVKELERLKREEAARSSLISNVKRVLLPLRARADAGTAQAVEAVLLNKLSRRTTNFSATLMTVSDVAQRAQNTTYLNQMAGAFKGLNITNRVAVGESVDNAILNEAKRDYDLMMIGASEGVTNTEILFTPIVDYLVRLAPCPVLVVRAPDVPEGWKPTRILIPTNGSLASRRAAELGFALATEGDETLHILRIVELSDTSTPVDVSGTLVMRQLKTAWQTVEQFAEIGAEVNTQKQVLVGKEPENEILSYAEDNQIDLIILGTSVSFGTERLYLGPRVERILKRAKCPVLIINT